MKEDLLKRISIITPVTAVDLLQRIKVGIYPAPCFLSFWLKHHRSLKSGGYIVDTLQDQHPVSRLICYLAFVLSWDIGLIA